MTETNIENSEANQSVGREELENLRADLFNLSTLVGFVYQMVLNNRETIDLMNKSMDSIRDSILKSAELIDLINKSMGLINDSIVNNTESIALLNNAVSARADAKPAA